LASSQRGKALDKTFIAQRDENAGILKKGYILWILSGQTGSL
jgi:hypothetical protein